MFFFFIFILIKKIFSIYCNQKKNKDKKGEAAPVEEKILYDKWGDPIKPKRKVRPLSLRAQNDKFEFTVHLHNTTIIEGRNARLICGVNSYSKNMEIIWYKNDRKIRFNEKNPRYEDFSRNATGCIGIALTELGDAAEYKCVFRDKDTEQTLETSCQIIVVPKIKKLKELSRMIPPAFVRKLQCKSKILLSQN